MLLSLSITQALRKAVMESFKKSVLIYQRSIFPLLIAVFKIVVIRLPWGLSGKESTSSAGDSGLIPDPGRSHMRRSSEVHVPHLLSLCSRAREPRLLSPPAATTEACSP